MPESSSRAILRLRKVIAKHSVCGEGSWCTRDAHRRCTCVQITPSAHTGDIRWSEIGANRLGSAHGRCIVKADGCRNGLQCTREAEWRLAPDGRSRPRLVSGRGPADKAAKDRPKAVPGRSQLPFRFQIDKASKVAVMKKAPILSRVGASIFSWTTRVLLRVRGGIPQLLHSRDPDVPCRSCRAQHKQDCSYPSPQTLQEL